MSRAIADAHGNIERIDRIADYPVTAVEFVVAGADVDAIRTGVTEAARQVGIDISVQPVGLDRFGRRLVVLDVDSTLIQDEVIELLAARTDNAHAVTAITDRAMRGEIDFTQSLTERWPCSPVHRSRSLRRSGSRCGWLQGTHAHPDPHRTRPRGGAGERRVHRGRGTGGGGTQGDPDPGQPARGCRRSPDRAGDRAGRDRAGKAAALREFAAEAGIPLSRTVAIGDGANDLDMMAAAGLGWRSTPSRWCGRPPTPR